MALLPELSEEIRRVRRTIAAGDLLEDLDDETVQDALLERAYEEDGETRYDRWGAASDVLLTLAARYARQVDMKSSDQEFKLSQKREGCLALSREFAGRARPRTAELTRDDTWF
jgi:hypothetical protein